MRIGDVIIGEEYASEPRWSYSRRRVRAVSIDKVTEHSGYTYAPNPNRQVRKVQVEVLDWDTGEPTPDDRLNGQHVRAAQLEPFAAVKQRIDEAEARDQAQARLIRRATSALATLGLRPTVVRTRSGGVEIRIPPADIDTLELLAERGPA